MFFISYRACVGDYQRGLIDLRFPLSALSSSAPPRLNPIVARANWMAIRSDESEPPPVPWPPSGQLARQKRDNDDKWKTVDDHPNYQVASRWCVCPRPPPLPPLPPCFRRSRWNNGGRSGHHHHRLLSVSLTRLSPDQAAVRASSPKDKIIGFAELVDTSKTNSDCCWFARVSCQQHKLSAAFFY